MLQSWIPGFNPDNPSNLAFPTWVSLRNLPHEHQDQAIGIAKTLGEVIGMQTDNENAKDPRFCVNQEISEGWATSIELVTKGGILPPQMVMIDYDKLPIRCRVWLGWRHKASDCKENQKRPIRRKERPLQNHQIHQQEKGKNIVLDHDGFQQVKSRKNTRKTIFAGELEAGQSKMRKETAGSCLRTFNVAAPAATHNNTEKVWLNVDTESAEKQYTLVAEVGRVTSYYPLTAAGYRPHSVADIARRTDNPGEKGCRNGSELRTSTAEVRSNGQANYIAKEGQQERRRENPEEEQSMEGDPPSNSDKRCGGAEVGHDKHANTKGQQSVVLATKINAQEAMADTTEEAVARLRKESTGVVSRSRGGEKTQDKQYSSESRMTGTSGEAMEGEGQSAFETTMNWSPTKISGQKRNIDVVDTDEESATTSSGEDEEEGKQDERRGRRA